MRSNACANLREADPGNSPRRRTASREGWVELHGRVVASETLQAPLSGDRCVLYQVEVGWRDLLFGRGGRELTEGAGFELEPLHALPGVDGRPLRVRIDATAAMVALAPRRWPVSRGVVPPDARDERLGALCARLGRRLPRLPTRWRERRLCDGDVLRVRGWLAWQPSSAGAVDGYREPPRIPTLRAALLMPGRSTGG